MPGISSSGNMSPQSIAMRSSPGLDEHHVEADLAEAAEGDQADGRLGRDVDRDGLGAIDRAHGGAFMVSPGPEGPQETRWRRPPLSRGLVRRRRGPPRRASRLRGKGEHRALPEVSIPRDARLTSRKPEWREQGGPRCASAPNYGGQPAGWTAMTPVPGRRVAPSPAHAGARLPAERSQPGGRSKARPRAAQSAILPAINRRVRHEVEVPALEQPAPGRWR